jgi:hypothetical protein
MAQDRFVHWNKEKPTVKELRCLLEDYLGDALVSIENSSSAKSRTPWWSVRLAGRPSAPWRRLKGYERLAFCMEMTEWRGFEVCVAGKHVDVITRLADEYTAGVADRFASLLARMYETKVTR